MTTLTLRPVAAGASSSGLLTTTPAGGNASYLGDDNDNTFYGSVTGGEAWLQFGLTDPAIPTNEAVYGFTGRLRGVGASQTIHLDVYPPGQVGARFSIVLPGSLGSVAAGFTSLVALSQTDMHATTARMTVPSGTTANIVEVYVDFLTAAIPVPTNVTPAAGSVVTSSRPAVNATATSVGTNFENAGTGGVAREWQFASDAGFTTNVTLVTEASYAKTKDTSIAPAWGSARLAQGTWYVRCRTVWHAGGVSAWSAANTFTVAHVPSTGNRVPSSGNTYLYSGTRLLDWDFSDIDPEDTQTALQVQMWKLSDPASPIDSGKVVSTSSQHILTVPDATWKDVELRWKVRVYDLDDVVSAYSSEQSFFLRDAPIVNITSPTVNQVITTSAPLITWNMSGTAGRTQAQWKVDITNTTTGVLAISSGWVAGTATEWQVPTPSVLVGPNYSVMVSVIDSLNLTNSSAHAFTSSYAAPTVATFTVSGANYASAGYNLIDWSGATLDSDFANWRVYRRLVGLTTWTLLFETATPTVRSFQDFTAPSQYAIEYSVVQVDYSFGVKVEGVYSAIATTGTLVHYMIVCPAVPVLNVILYHVSADQFSDESEEATINLIGRGRRLEVGTRYGQTGSLEASLRDQSGGPSARVQRIAIEGLRNAARSGYELYLLNPFGDVWRVSIGAATVSRVAGVGLHEMATVSITYSEITA